MSELPMRDEEPDETNDFGRYTPEHEPDAEDELYAVILALVEQGCGTKDHDKLDSGAISAYERAIETLVGAGFVEIDGEGRIGAMVLPKARKFEAWMEAYDRRKRIWEARHKLGTVPGLMPEDLAMLYDITVAELVAEMPPKSL